MAVTLAGKGRAKIIEGEKKEGRSAAVSVVQGRSDLERRGTGVVMKIVVATRCSFGTVVLGTYFAGRGHGEVKLGVSNNQICPEVDFGWYDHVFLGGIRVMHTRRIRQ